MVPLVNFSRTFNAWKYVTADKLIVKLPLQYPMRPHDYVFNQMEVCHQGNQIILTFDKVSNISKDSQYTFSRYEAPGNEGTRAQYSDKSDPIWR